MIPGCTSTTSRMTSASAQRRRLGSAASASMPRACGVPGGVDQGEGPPAPRRLELQAIPGHARHLVGDRRALAEEPVHEGRLAHVLPSDHGDLGHCVVIEQLRRPVADDVDRARIVSSTCAPPVSSTTASAAGSSGSPFACFESRRSCATSASRSATPRCSARRSPRVRIGHQEQLHGGVRGTRPSRCRALPRPPPARPRARCRSRIQVRTRDGSRPPTPSPRPRRSSNAAASKPSTSSSAGIAARPT